MKKIAKTLIDTKILDRALAVGVLCEAAFVIAAHYRPFLGLHFGLFACMMIAGTAALLYARNAGVGICVGGSANETDQSTRITTHIALACRADLMLGKPGGGSDEALMLQTNEMLRALALLHHHQATPTANSPK